MSLVESVGVFALPPPIRLARISLDQYHRMLETGILSDGDPVELLEGLLVCKDRSARGEDPMTIGKRHNVAVGGLSDLNPKLRKHGCHLQAQGPLAIPPHHEPEPDGAILVGDRRDFLSRFPAPGDVLCVIEVADSALARDRGVKQAIYAGAGIAQYVIVNLMDDCAEVFEQPLASEGRYGLVSVLGPDQTLSFHLPGGQRLPIPVRSLLP